MGRWLLVIMLCAPGIARAETYEPAGRLRVTCTQPGVEVLLDYKPWFTCPGTESKIVEPGEHAVHGSHPDREPMTHKLEVTENGTVDLEINLAAAERMVITRRFPAWMPWTVLGVGVVSTAFGALLYSDGHNGMQNYKQRVASACASGCPPEVQDDLDQIRDKARTRTTLGTTVLVGGALVTITGIVLSILNVPVVAPAAIAVVPTSSGASAQASWRF